MTPDYTDWTQRLVLPVGSLLAAYWLQGVVAGMHPAYLELLNYLPWVLAATAIILGNQFRQTAIATAAVLQVATFFVVQTWLQEPLRHTLPNQVFILLSLLQPFNWVFLSFVPEQKLLSRFGAIYCTGLLLQFSLVALLVSPDAAPLLYENGWLRLQGVGWSWMPLSSVVLHILGVSLLGYRLFKTGNKSDGALLGCLLLNGAMLSLFEQPQISLVVASIGLVLLLTSIILFSHDLAFVDELTQLPGRRALMSDLKLAGNQYTVAMLDIDFFKKFNDTYGHDTGDQVLKLVASRLARVTGGGKAYRYGGEEFTILFRGKELEECLPHLEQVRETIARYRLVLRDRKRSQNHSDGKQQRGQVGDAEQKKVQITISIGAAEREKPQLPLEVMKQADIALYSAKEAGRNCVKHR